MGSRELATARVPHGVPAKRTRRRDRATEARPTKLAKAGSPRGVGGEPGGPSRGKQWTAGVPPSRPDSSPSPFRAPRPRRCARTCALLPAMWQLGGGGAGGGCKQSPAPLGPRRARRSGAALGAPELGGLRTRSPDGAEVRRQGRGRAGARGRLPRPAHSPPPWPCVRGRRWPRQ